MRLRLVAALIAVTASSSTGQPQQPPPDQQSQDGTTQPPQDSSSYASSDSGSMNDPNEDAWMTSWTSEGSVSTSGSGLNDVEVGDTSGSSSDWWMADNGPESLETLPLSWMGEFDPEWTRDMAYPALGTVFRPTLAGKKELRRARKSYLDASTVTTIESREYGGIGCRRHICLNITVRSQYGALSDFEAFVLDRIESKAELEVEGFEIGGPARLIRGQISLEELDRVFGEFGSFNMTNDTNSDANVEYELLTASATGWMLYPKYDHDTDEIDVTMSFKQLYTLLPGYDAVGHWLEGSGPYYSDDPNDQVIIHLIGQRSNSDSSSSGMFPLVVNSTGSTLFAVDYVATLSSVERIINVEFSFTRKRYGAIPPWTPGEMRAECKESVAKLMENSDIGDCVLRFVSDERLQKAFEDALWMSPTSWNPAISLNRAADECFGSRYLLDALAREDVSMGSNISDGASGYGSVGWDSAGMAGSHDGGANDDAGWELKGPLEAVKQADEAFRGLVALNCSIGSREFASSAGKMNILKHDPTSVRVVYSVPDYSLFMELFMDDSSFFTPTFSSNDSVDQVTELIQSSLPSTIDYNLDVAVTFGDNLAEIADLERKNEWIRLHYPNADESSSSSQSSVGDAGSFDNPHRWHHRRWHHRPDGSYDSHRYRNVDSSFEGDESSSSGRHNDHRDNDVGDAGGSDPSLFYVPPPEYFVEVEFRNVSIVPRVRSVFPSDGNYDFRMERQTRNVYLGTTPLQVQSFQYVPPPEGLDLFWYEGVDDTSDTCGECMDLAIACYADENCRFGVDTYLLDAVEHIMPGGDRDEGIDITYIFRQAQQFFPQDGFEKLNKVITCLATRSPPCDLDRPHPLESLKFSGSITRAPPTSLQISPATGAFGVDIGSFINVLRSTNGWWSGFMETGNSSDFESFFIMDVMRMSADEFYGMGGSIWTYNESSMNEDGFTSSSNSDGGWGGVNVGDWSGNTNMGDATIEFENLVKHWISLGNSLESFPIVTGAHAFSTSPWTVSIGIQGHASSDHKRLDGAPFVQWQRVLDWISIVRGWSSEHNTDIPPLPLDGNSICSECRTKLTECVTDYSCFSGVHEVVIPSMLSRLGDSDNSTSYSSFDLDGVWDLWSKNFSSPSSYSKFVDFFGCLRREFCAIGWSLGNTHSWNPTTLGFRAATSVILEYWGWMNIEFDGTELSYSASAYGNAGEFVKNNVLHDATEMQWLSQSYPYMENSTFYYFSFADPMVSYPKFTITSGEGNVSEWRTVSVNTNLNNQASLQQVLSGLISWFSVSSTNSSSSNSDSWTAPFGSSDVCVHCAQTIQACMENNACHDVVISNLLPNWLTPSSGLYNPHVFVTVAWSDSSMTAYTYTGDLMDIVNAIRDQLKNEEAWLAFANIFPCLARELCDLKYMTAAADVPATSHQPTYLVFKPASVSLTLSLHDKITVFVNDVEFTFTYDDFGSSTTFISWLQQELSTIGVPTDIISLDFPSDNSFHCVISFTDYMGTPPIFHVEPSNSHMGFMAPIMTPWRVDFQSNSITPEWPKLNDLLSFSAAGTLVSDDSMDVYRCNECQAIRDQVLTDSWLQYILTSQFIPLLNTAASTMFSTDDIHEIDLTNDLFWTVLPSAGSWAMSSVLDLLRCVADQISPGSSCIDESSKRGARGAVAKVIVEDAYSEITIPVETYVSCTWNGMSGTVIYHGDPTAFATSIAGELFSSDSGITVAASADISADDVHHLTITFQKLQALNLPHCSADTPQGFVQSIAHQPKYALRSSTSPLGEPFTYWIQWLQGVSQA